MSDHTTAVDPAADPTHRRTSYYTLTLGVEHPAAATDILVATLDAAGIERAGIVGDDTYAGIAWRTTSDTQALAHAAVLIYAVGKQQPVRDRRLHTGFGAHVRDLVME